MTGHDDDGINDRGLAFDLDSLRSRRTALKVLGGVGLLGVAGCAAARTSSAPSTAASGYEPIPEETGGPFPGDGSNGPNVLDDDGIVRSDITSSFGTGSAVAEGVPTSVELVVVAAGTGKALEGATVYLWHCDREGRYSIYDSSLPNENYLRGVQAAGADGVVRFETVFPACYSGRWPHMHFEVYAALEDATGGGSPLATSQLAIPADVCETVYATSGYEQSVSNLARVSLERDGIFSDGADLQTPSISGSVDDGYVFRLTVPVTT